MDTQQQKIDHRKYTGNKIRNNYDYDRVSRNESTLSVGRNRYIGYRIKWKIWLQPVIFK